MDISEIIFGTLISYPVIFSFSFIAYSLIRKKSAKNSYFCLLGSLALIVFCLIFDIISKNNIIKGFLFAGATFMPVAALIATISGNYQKSNKTKKGSNF